MAKKNILKAFFSKNIFITFLLGFSSGLPLLLIGGTLKAWFARDGVDIKTIGFMSGVGMAYSLKFLWAPFLDRYIPTPLGRRRSWMLITQILLAIFIFILGHLDPKTNLILIAVLCIIVAFLSASQDISIDAYRREVLPPEELGLGSSVSMFGYRIAMLLSGGLGLYLVDPQTAGWSWSQLYTLMAICMGVGIVATLMAPEPEVPPIEHKGFIFSVIDPFIDFLKRPGSLLILYFIFSFKLGDAIAGAMLNPFYVQMGYSNQDIGLIAKTFGLASSMIGLLIGASLIYYMSLFRALLLTGILQSLSTAFFALITLTGPLKWALGVTVIFEDVSAGMGNAAFVAYISMITNKKYTATQFALLSSIATLGRNFISIGSGIMVEKLGWAQFFYTCSALVIPSLLTLIYLNNKNRVHNE